MNEREKSDRLVVPVKSANKSFWDFAQELAERAEGRGLAKEKEGGDEPSLREEGQALLPAEPATQADRTRSRVGEGGNTNPEGLSQKLERIRAAARRDKRLRFTSLW